MFAVAAVAVIVGPPQRAQAEPYPGQSEIDAARAAANDAASSVDQLDAAIASLADARDAATAGALLAADLYAEAQFDAQQAQATLTAAQERSAEANEKLDAARRDLASVAQAAYRDSGSMSQVGAVVGAETVDEVIARSEAFSRGSDEMDMRVQEVKAAELVATTMGEAAQAAADAAVEAERTAASSLAEAEDAQAHAESAVAEAETTRQDAIARLASLRGVTVALEQQRQDGLEADRTAAARAQAQRDQARAEQEWQQSNPQPTTPAPQPTTPAPQPTTPAPQPTTPAPGPTTPAPQPTTPAPAPTEQPGGSWRTTAAQGEAAAAAAIRLTGAEYLLGGTGPRYDCSGLTSTAWSSAGQWITRTSRSQYQATTHLPYSQLRPGDLVFYATNTADPSTIYHVAMYVGNGQVMEARNYSVLAGVRGLYASMNANLMPYIGRP